MSTTRALIVHSAGDLRLETVPLREPGPDDAVVRIAYGGICGSDLHYWKHGAVGESILREPLVLGHEVVGTVETAAADGSGPAAGTNVAVHPARRVPSDVPFPADRPNLSPGVRYLGSAATFPHTQGAFADRVVLPASMLRALPDGLDLVHAAIAEPAGVAWHALRRAGDVAGKRVLVIGVGPIGALIVAAAKRAGAGEIIAVDVQRNSLDIATRLGATRAILATDADAVAGVYADVTFEASGNHRGLASAVHGTTRGGRLVMVGLPPAGEQPALISLMITRELEVTGALRFIDEIDDAIAALADGSLRADAAVTHTFDVADYIEAFDVASDPARSGKVLIAF